MGLKFKPPKTSGKKQQSYSPTKRNIPKWQWYFLVLLMVSPLIYFIIKLFMELYFVVAPGFVTFEPMVIRAPEDGYIKKVTVNAGDHLKASQLLLSFNSPKVNKRLELLQNELKALKKEKAQAVNEEVNSLKKLRQEAQDNVKKTREHYKRFQQLKKQGLITVIELKNVWDSLHVARSELIDIERRLNASQQNHQFSIEEQYNKRLREVKNELETLHKLKESFSVTVDQPVTVTHVATHEGEYVTKGQVLLELVTKKNFHIRALVEPEHLNEVYKGKQVTIIFPDKTKIKGVIVNNPSFAKQSKGELSILKNEKNKIVFLVKATEPVPDKFKIYGVPVKVDVDQFFQW